MYCRNCGKEVSEEAVVCVACGVPPKRGKSFCQNCGAPTSPKAKKCLKCRAKLATPGKSWLAALLLSIFLGPLGADRFYLGYIVFGTLKLLTLGGCGIWWLIDAILIASNVMKDARGNPLEK